MKKSLLKTMIVSALAAAMILSMAACGGSSSSASGPVSYADGVYTGRSLDHDADEDGHGSGYGEVEIEIKDGEIVSCDFLTYELDGTLKDDSYGSDMAKENRLKAQKAVQSAAQYAAVLVEAGSLDSVDAISGATICYDEFIEAVNDALAKASSQA